MQFDAKYYDGLSAASHHVRVALGTDAIVFNHRGEDHIWRYTEVSLATKVVQDIRLVNKKHVDALLVLPLESFEQVSFAAPDLLSGHRERKRMTRLIVGLIAASTALAGIIFFGVPAASGPLAHATPKEFEQQIGENLAAQIQTFFSVCENSQEATAQLQPLIDEMALVGEVGFPITFSFVETSMPNAFALPGGQVMITSGLLDLLADDRDAVVAVLAHELGHVRARDGMQAVYRNAGLGILLEIITGGSGAAQQLVLIGGQLNQLRHTRKQESAADKAAIDILQRLGANPATLARAFEKFKTIDHDHADDSVNSQTKMPAWLKSHPELDKRIKVAKAAENHSTSSKVTDDQWKIVLTACKTANEPEKKEAETN